MANVGISDDLESVLQEQVEILKELDKELWDDVMLDPTESSIERFKEVYIKLSSLLPDVSDCKTFEIDDLLYPEDDKTITNISKTALYSEETNILISQRCFNYYCYFYLSMIFSRNQRPKTALYDRTYLQLLEYVLRIPLSESTIDYKRLTGLISMLLFSMNDFKLCIAIKIMTFGANNIKEIYNKYQDHGVFCYLRRLPEIPQAKDPKKRRITTWLSEQSKYILETIDFKSLELKNIFIRQYLDTFGEGDHTSIEYLRLLRWAYSSPQIIIFQINKLHTYFMSARNEEEKLERLTTYLQSLLTNHEKFSETAFFTTQCSPVVEALLTIMRQMEIFKHYTDEELRRIEKHHNYVMEPYLSDDGFNSLVWRPNVRQLINEKLSDDNEKETSEEHDYTVEHFILFDDLMKIMHVLNILYTASYKCADLLKTTGFVGDAAIFRSRYSPIIEYLKDVIVNPSKRGYIPWAIETVLKKCPFMILSNCHDYLMEDLIKLLKGDHVDEITQEELFYALNTSYFKDDMR